jgi:hypothetical protein
MLSIRDCCSGLDIDPAIVSKAMAVSLGRERHCGDTDENEIEPDTIRRCLHDMRSGAKGGLGKL